MRESERRAQIILSKLFDEYCSLTEYEAPDWIDKANSIALEVTSAVSPDISKQEAFCAKQVGKAIDSIPLKSIEAIEAVNMRLISSINESGCKCGTVMGCSRVYTDLEHKLVLKAIEAKYQKKYSHYKHFALYILAYNIFCELFTNEWREQVLKTARFCESIYPTRFNRIIIDFYKKLLVFDLDTDCVSEYIYDDEIL